MLARVKNYIFKFFIPILGTRGRIPYAYYLEYLDPPPNVKDG